MFADVVLDRVLGKLRVLPHHDESAQSFPEILVRHPECGRLDHVGMSADEVFDLGREDVLAAGDDHLVVAAADVEQALGVEVAHIAGGHQAVDDLLSTATGVALEREAVADEDPPDLTPGHLIAVVVEDLYLDAPDHRADGGRVLRQILRAGDARERDFG